MVEFSLRSSNPIRRLLAASRRWGNEIDGITQHLYEAPSRVNAAPNPFWRNTRLEKHENDPLNTDPPAPAPAVTQPRDIVCGACGCKIARSGEILKTGETYKQFLKHEQAIEEKDREIAKLTAENAALKTEVTTLKAQGSGGGSASGHRPGGRVQ